MLRVEKIELGVMRNNCYILYNDAKESVVIDPGAGANRLLDLLGTLGVTVKHILLTHAHFDHIGAVDAVAERYNCDVLVSKEDEPLLHDPYLNVSQKFKRQITIRANFVLINFNMTYAVHRLNAVFLLFDHCKIHIFFVICIMSASFPSV